MATIEFEETEPDPSADGKGTVSGDANHLGNIQHVDRESKEEKRNGMKVTWQPSAAKLSNEALKERSCSASSGRKMRTKYLPPTSSVFRSNTLTDFVLVHLDHVVEGEDVLWSTVTMTFSLRVLEVTGTYISLGSVCFNRVFTFFNKKDDLVNFHLLTILRGQGHISKVIVLKFLKAQLCHSYWPNIVSEKWEVSGCSWEVSGRSSRDHGSQKKVS